MTGRLEAYRVAVEEQGPADGPVLVLGHALGSSSDLWRDVLPSLTARYRTLCWELPGHGRSGVGPAGAPHTMDWLVDSVLAELDRRGVRRFHVGGLSLGGMAALAIAEAVPERAETLTIMSSDAVNPPPERWRDRARDVRAHGTGTLVDPTMGRWFSEGFRTGAGAGRVAQVRATYAACQAEGYAQCCEILQTADLRPGLGALRMPVLIVAGQNDGSLSPAGARALAESIRARGNPDVTVSVIPIVRHLSAVEDPAAVAATLTGFLARH